MTAGGGIFARRSGLAVLWVLVAIVCSGSFARASPPSRGTDEILATTAVDTLFVAPMTHLDIGFTAPPADVAESFRANIDNVIEYASTLPDFRWTVTQVWIIDQWLERTDDPEKIARFFELVREGRISVAAGYANQHTAMMGEEETARLFYPARRLAEEHGIATEIFVMNDVPGWSWSLPQALARSGVKYFLAGVNAWLGGVADVPRSRLPFFWRGPDGSRVLTWIAHDGYAGLRKYGLVPDTPLADMPEMVADQIAAYEDEGYPYDSILVVGARYDNWDSSGFTATWLRTRIAQWNHLYGRPRMILATPEEFFRHLEEAYGDGFATESGNSSGLWDGLNSIAPAGTAMVRWAHDHAPAAEKLNTVNRLLGLSPYHEADFDLVYTKMLEADEHCSGGPGWPFFQSRAKVEETNAAHFEFATTTRAVTAARLAAELQTLGLAARAVAHPRIVVYNPLSWRRSAPVEVVIDAELLARGFRMHRPGSRRPIAYQRRGSGQIVFIAEDVPAFGYQIYDLVPTHTRARFRSHARAPGDPLKNRHYELRIDPDDGRIVSIWDRRAKRDLVRTNGAFEFNALIKASNVDELFWGDYQVLPPAGAPRISATRGPVSSRLRILREGHPLGRTEIILYRDLPRLDIVNTVVQSEMAYVPYAEHSWHYSLTFPFHLDLRRLVTRVETTAGFLSPPRSGYLPGAITGTQLSQHAIDLREEGGFGVTVAHRQAFSATVGRVNRYFYDPLEPTLIFRTVQDFDEGATRDLGIAPIQAEPVTVHDFAFSLTSSDRFSAIEVSRFGWGFASPLQAIFVPAGPAGALARQASQSFLSVDAPNVVLINFKPAHFGERSDFVVRLREIAGEPTRATLKTPFVVIGAQEASLVETPRPGASLGHAPVSFEIGPYELKTIRLRIAPAFAGGRDSRD